MVPNRPHIVAIASHTLSLVLYFWPSLFDISTALTFGMSLTMFADGVLYHSPIRVVYALSHYQRL
jgi:hypothetical protein